MESITEQVNSCLTGLVWILLFCFEKKLNGPFPASFFFIFVFSTVNSKYVHYKILPMTIFKPQTSGIGSDRSAN